jgi:hypothetical protein
MRARRHLIERDECLKRAHACLDLPPKQASALVERTLDRLVSFCRSTDSLLARKAEHLVLSRIAPLLDMGDSLVREPGASNSLD